MADENKPRIDLRGRLGRSGADPGPAMPPPISPMAPSPPTAQGSAPNLLSPNVASTSSNFGALQAESAWHPSRIEFDEASVDEARKRGKRQGLAFAAIASVLFCAVGYVAGGALEKRVGHEKARSDAADLAKNVTASTETLKQLLAKIEAGRDQLIKSHKFPDTLAHDLGAIHVSFDGTELAGRRFSGFPQDVTHDLVEFITSVQSVNDRKAVMIGLLNKLQKPLTEELNAPPGGAAIAHVVVIDKDALGNPAALLQPLVQPVAAPVKKGDLPDEFVFAGANAGNTKLPRYKAGDLANGSAAAVYVVPRTFETVCPSDKSGHFAQLAAQMGNFVREIRGEAAAVSDVVQDLKPGLIERAGRLTTALAKVAE